MFFLNRSSILSRNLWNVQTNKHYILHLSSTRKYYFHVNLCFPIHNYYYHYHTSWSGPTRKPVNFGKFLYSTGTGSLFLSGSTDIDIFSFCSLMLGCYVIGPSLKVIAWYFRNTQNFVTERYTLRLLFIRYSIHFLLFLCWLFKLTYCF